MRFRDDAILIAIREKNIQSILDIFIDRNGLIISSGFKTETELWDFKSKVPKLNSDEIEWAEIAKDVLGFYNNKGGLIIFGIDDSTFSIIGLDASYKIDSKLFNDKIRKYTGDKIWVEYQSEYIGQDRVQIGLAIIPSKASVIEKFKKNSPEKKGRCFFLEGGSAIRKNDSTFVLNVKEARDYEIDSNLGVMKKYEVNEPFYRILCKEYSEFVYRDKYCRDIIKGLNHNRAAVVSLVGIGGVGKTALATWAVLSSYKNEEYEFIVSITAKDRELNTSGISAIKQELTSYDTLLNSILDVLCFPDLKSLEIPKKEIEVKELLKDTKGLLFIDNLETVNDNKIIDFLNNLPDGVKAIVTSRRNMIRYSAYPVEIGAMEPYEVVNFINSLIKDGAHSYAKSLSEIEKEKLGMSCNGIPLAIKWLLSKSKSVQELLAMSEQLENSGLIGDELLEFSFRRIFDDLSLEEKEILRVLAIVPSISSEAIMKGSNLNSNIFFKYIEVLTNDTIIYKVFDNNINDYVYNILPLTRSFLLKNIVKPSEEKEIRKRLSNWFEALDVTDANERIIVREMRQGNKNPGDVLVGLAKASLRRGDEDSALKFFTQAMARDPKNWRVYKDFGEYYRHYRESISESLKYYQMAIDYSPKDDSYDIAILNREYAMLLKDCGERNATDRAIAHAKIAKNSIPNDPITANILAILYERKGHYNLVVETLEPFKDSTNIKTLRHILPLLVNAYEKNGDLVKLQEAKLTLNRI